MSVAPGWASADVKGSALWSSHETARNPAHELRIAAFHSQQRRVVNDVASAPRTHALLNRRGRRRVFRKTQKRLRADRRPHHRWRRSTVRQREQTLRRELHARRRYLLRRRRNDRRDECAAIAAASERHAHESDGASGCCNPAERREQWVGSCYVSVCAWSARRSRPNITNQSSSK